MAENYSAQNSITIKRLRSNDSLMLTFENNGIPLFQAVDEESDHGFGECRQGIGRDRGEQEKRQYGQQGREGRER